MIVALRSRWWDEGHGGEDDVRPATERSRQHYFLKM